MYGTGGYVIVELKDIGNLESGRGHSKTIPEAEVNKLKQFEKPVLLRIEDFSIDGGNASFLSFMEHRREAGVHSQISERISITVTGDTTINITAKQI